MSGNEINDPKALEEAFWREVDDNPPEDLKGRNQEKFDRLRMSLLAEESWISDRDPDILALDLIELLAKELRCGQATPKAQNMLADFLGSVLARSSASPTAWEEETRLAYRILGYQSNGRPTNRMALERALAAFVTHRGNGTKAAEQAAFDAYQAALGHPELTYASCVNRKVDVTRGRYSSEVTVAERLLQSTIRPALRRAGLIDPKTKGRKPRSGDINAKPHP